jgi:hypothetical protein
MKILSGKLPKLSASGIAGPVAETNVYVRVSQTGVRLSMTPSCGRTTRGLEVSNGQVANPVEFLRDGGSCCEGMGEKDNGLGAIESRLSRGQPVPRDRSIPKIDPIVRLMPT